MDGNRNHYSYETLRRAVESLKKNHKEYDWWFEHAGEEGRTKEPEALELKQCLLCDSYSMNTRPIEHATKGKGRACQECIDGLFKYQVKPRELGPGQGGAK